MTQMFFDNQKFFDFVKTCRNNGINTPIIPGLKPITTKKQLSLLPRIFHVDIPSDLSEEITRCKTDDDCEKVGTEWLIQQSRELKKFRCSCFALLHFRQTKSNKKCCKRIGDKPLTHSLTKWKSQ